MVREHKFIDGIILEDYPEEFGPPTAMSFFTWDGQPCDKDGNLLDKVAYYTCEGEPCDKDGNLLPQ